MPQRSWGPPSTQQSSPSPMRYRAAGSETGRERSMTASIRVKMAVVPPMPRAEGEDGRGREDRRLPELPQGVAKIAEQIPHVNYTALLEKGYAVHQSLSARTGSVRVARQAGRKQAASDAIVITTKADPNASGSRGLTW